MSETPRANEYDHRDCQSLFGYAAAVHERSGGICQLCGAGSSGIDFDLWRQLTVERLIGEAQGGYLRQISAALARRFPGLAATALAELAGRIDAANTVTACSFCNSMTSGVLDPDAVFGGSGGGCRLLPGVGNAGSAAGSAQRARVPGAGP